jgi:hypothetical protein
VSLPLLTIASRFIVPSAPMRGPAMLIGPPSVRDPWERTPGLTSWIRVPGASDVDFHALMVAAIASLRHRK